MQFQIGVKTTLPQTLRPGIPDLLQRVLNRNAGIIGRRHHALQGDQLGKRHRTHHGRTETSPLFIGPADDLDAALGLKPAVVQRAQDFQPT